MTDGRPALTVATWNIRAAIGPGEPFPPAWWRHVRRERIERIGDVIRRLDADVVSLQEVAVLTVDGGLVDLPSELAMATGMEVRYAATGHFGVVEPETGRSAGATLWGNAVLSRLPILESWAVGLPMAGDEDVVEPIGTVHPLDGTPHPLAGVRYADAPTGSREPRCLLRVTVEGASGPVHVLSTHLTHVGDAQRRGQAAVVAETAGGLDGPVVVAGDLNAPIDAPSMEPLRTLLADAFLDTGTPPGDERRLSCGPWAIDHILVAGLEPRACRVVREAGDASDHWPVIASFG